ncbi:MAG: hypothetical protein ACHQM4_00915 [Thermoanaerobaculia bacterium]
MSSSPLLRAVAACLLAASLPAVAGTITPVSAQSVSFPAHANSMTFGPDGNVWLVDSLQNLVGRLSLSGTFTPFPIPTANGTPWAIVSGADGNLWFTEISARRIGRVTTAGVITEFFLPPTFVGAPWQIAATPDGSIWFLEEGDGKHIGRLGVDGKFAEFLPSGAQFLAGLAVAGGYLWAVDTYGGVVFRIQPDGSSTSFPTTGPSGLGTAAGVEGPDGNLWFTHNTNAVARMTPAGVFTEFPVPTQNSSPTSPTVGGDGNIWFSEYNSGKIGQLVVSTATSGGAATINETASLASGPADLIFLPKTAFAGSSAIAREPASGRTGLDSNPCDTKIIVRADEQRSNCNDAVITIPGPSTCADLGVYLNSDPLSLDKYNSTLSWATYRNLGPADAGAGTFTINFTPPVRAELNFLVGPPSCSSGSKIMCTPGYGQVVCAFARVKNGEICEAEVLWAGIVGFNDIQFVSATVTSVTFDPDPTNNNSRVRVAPMEVLALPPDVPTPVNTKIRRGIFP